MERPPAACTRTPGEAFSTAYLMGLYSVLACRTEPTTEMQVFLESLCDAHHPHAIAILDELIVDEADTRIRIALTRTHDQQSRKRSVS
jgi:hypothetical protein